ncbi:PREDICTED: uncharacterized protein LOC105954527 [Erythranthe guttata]|uniref:uncharacterized protein LOC105954527 n=1 Tax=Erythranthe guttata TaxID=4155 RepID=UPI00064DCE59|nr:PREDICTED: uncharacterized protein LOC105954527 [Erythranthe guttata]|eukprot:XP_012833651.1 PREDICTED: uncharacterized protein LOC105954527 [Erythranthe guttata]
MISKSQKTIHSVVRDLDMDSKFVTLVDEDLQTIREITSDSGESPDPLKILLFGTDGRSKHFQEHIPSYNMMFSFTSIGGKIQTTINRGSGPYTFLLHGQNYHLMGSLLPDEGSRPKFAQLYIFDTENEVNNRMDTVRSGDSSSELDPEIVSTFKDMVDNSNMLAQSYRAARDRLSQTGMEDEGVRDIVVETRSKKLQRISELHPLYLPLQYPLIFP